MSIDFIDKSDDWLDAQVLTVGNAEAGQGISVHVGLACSTGKRIRIDIRAGGGYSCFQAVRWVGNVAYIGFGQYLFVVDTARMTATEYVLDGYFCDIYSPADIDAEDGTFSALVASASELLCFSAEGELRWKTVGLGVDGIVVHRVRGQFLMGDGEFDPPGGWRSFTLDLASGQ